MADENRIHPLRDFLLSLEWDKKLRLPKFAETYFGATPDALANAAGRLIPVGMCARILQPGCQYDYATVLMGRQGCGKSSSLRILAGDAYFEDSVPLTAFDPSKIVLERTRGRWLVELSELAGFRYSDQETVKAMISSRADSARLAYSREAENFDRQFIFAATTNAQEFLRDTTGARRFPVVPCGTIDLDALERDRDQILAEAVVEAKKMLPSAITIPPALWAAQTEQAETRRLVGGFEEWITTYVEKHERKGGGAIIATSLRETMSEEIKGTPQMPNNAEFSQVMQRLGFRHRRERQPNGSRPWVWERE